MGRSLITFLLQISKSILKEMIENKKVFVGILALVVIMLLYGFFLVMNIEGSLTGWVLIFLGAGIFLIVLNRYERKSKMWNLYFSCYLHYKSHVFIFNFSFIIVMFFMVLDRNKGLKDKERFYKELEKFIWRNSKEKSAKILESFIR